MNQIKSGQFIAEQRKSLGYTQLQLAEIISVSDRTISKWERGAGMPDVSLMLPLCNALNITVNELLSGEKIPDNVIKEKSDENVIDIVKSYKKKNKITFFAVFTVLFFACNFVNMILADRYVTKQFMNAGTEMSIILESETELAQKSPDGLSVVKENIPAYRDFLSENFELLKFPTCILLTDSAGNVLAKTDTDETTDDYKKCCVQAEDFREAKPGYMNMSVSGKEFSCAVPFECQNETYIISAYSSHNQLVAALESEFFLFALMVIGICFLGILIFYSLVEKVWISSDLKKTQTK